MFLQLQGNHDSSWFLPQAIQKYRGNKKSEDIATDMQKLRCYDALLSAVVRDSEKWKLSFRLSG